jgi:transaldolase
MTTSPATSPNPAGDPAGELRIKLFADGAGRDEIIRLAGDPAVAGFTTNPTLMRASGVTDYSAFAHSILPHLADKPISFEVFADEAEEMERQARAIASWGPNIYVKIPVTNTRRESCAGVVRRLSQEGVRVNVTAVFTLEQVEVIAGALEGGAPSVISIFAGRIADTGRDPVPHMQQAVKIAARSARTEILWASSREVLNVYQAQQAGCHIITLTPDLFAKLPLHNKDLLDYSQDTVKAFHRDAAVAGFQL